jgi:hypothetical protein
MPGLLLIAAPLTIAPFMVNGLGGQIVSAQYPASWAKVNSVINQQPGTVMALPWQAYVRHSLAQDHLIANPVKVALDQPVITSAMLNQVRLDTSQSPLDTIVQDWLQLDHINLAKLRAHHINYIMLQKEADWQRYLPAIEAADLVQLYDGPHLQLYQVP